MSECTMLRQASAEVGADVVAAVVAIVVADGGGTGGSHVVFLGGAVPFCGARPSAVRRKRSSGVEH